MPLLLFPQLSAFLIKLPCPWALPQSSLRPQASIQCQQNKEIWVLMLSHWPWCQCPAHRLKGVAQTYSVCQQGRVGVWRDKEGLYKALQRDRSAPSLSPVAMWFLVLCLILSLAEYGEKLRDPWEEEGIRLLPCSPHKSSLSYQQLSSILQPTAFLGPGTGVLISCGATLTPHLSLSMLPRSSRSLFSTVIS